MKTDVKILRLPDVLEMIQLSRTTIYRLIQKGDFPKPGKLGKRANRWKNTDIEEWIENRPSA